MKNKDLLRSLLLRSLQSDRSLQVKVYSEVERTTTGKLFYFNTIYYDSINLTLINSCQTDIGQREKVGDIQENVEIIFCGKEVNCVTKEQRRRLTW